MSDYTPTTEEIRARAIRSTTYPQFESPTLRDAWDRWLAAHDAEKRAEWEAEQGWEYGEQSKLFPDTVWIVDPDTQSMIWDDIPEERRVRRRTAGPWVPVNENGSE